MHAIKSKNKLPFRRDGVAFPSHQWLLVPEPTERQLSDPSLLVIEDVEILDDPRLAPLGVANPELLAVAPEAPAEPEAPQEPEAAPAPKKGK